MAPRLRLLRTKCWTERINLAECHGSCFDVQLAGLCEKCLLVEIVDGKERTGAFAGRRCDDGRIRQGETALIEEISRSLDDLSPNAQNRRLTLRPHPEMAVLHQEISAMLFGSNRVGRRLGHALHHMHVGHIEFVAAMGALVSADFSLHDHTRFLREGLNGIEDLRRHRILRYHTLNDAGAVTKLREQQLPAFAQVVKPAADRDRLAFVFADFCNRCYG